MRVLAVDPSLRCTGYAVLEAAAQRIANIGNCSEFLNDNLNNNVSGNVIDLL